MTAPERTTFEVTVSNRLEYNAAYIQIQAELQYATELSLSLNNKNSQKTHQQYTQSNTQSNAFTDTESKSDSNKTQNILSSRKSIILSQSQSADISQSQASANSQSTEVSASGGGYGFEVSASVNHSNANEQSSSGSTAKSSAESSSKSQAQSSDRLKDNSAFRSNSKQRSKSSAISGSNKSSNEYDKSKSLNSSSKVENIKITPGFVRIACGQSLAIPVIVENESQVVYITVYIQDHKSGERFCIANALQTNRQHIEIKRNDKNNDIILQPAERKQSYDFREMLTEWGLPAFIQDAMDLSGWDDPNLWHEITESDLIKMGFKRGHVVKFNNEFTRWKTNKDIQNDCVDYKILLKEWQMPIDLFDSMKKAGWDEYKLWDKINDNDFKEMKFSRGHVVKFKSYIENNKHLKLFEKLKTQNLYEDNDNNITNSESKYDRPDPPKFTINKNEIYHTSFHLNLLDFNHNHMYIVEINKDKNAIHNWDKIDTINPKKHKKRHQIKQELEPNTIYYVRVMANNNIKTSDPSDIWEIKTKNQKWINENITIPTLNYKVTNYKGTNYESKKIFIKFDENEMKKIENNKFNQKYNIQIGFNNDDEKTIAGFKHVADINTNTLNYDFNLNNNDIKKENILICFQCINNINYPQVTEPKILKFNQIFKPDPPKFTIDKNKIYPNCFELELPDCDYNFTYVIEFNKNKYKTNDWKRIGTINPNKRTKKYRCEPLLKPNAIYYVRVKAKINSNTSDPSDILRIKTKDQKWIDKNLIIPTQNYKVTLNNESQKIFIEFEENEMKKIENNNKFDQKYKIQIGFNSDDEKTMTECKFEDLEIINTNKLIYIYNLNNKNIKNENILIRFQCINNINYTQFTEAKTFTLSQILIKQSFQKNQIGKHLKIVNHNKIENISHGYSIALFGYPITNNMCNKYDIYVKLSYSKVFLGYVTNKDSIKNWDTSLADDDNRKESVSMCIGKDGDEWLLNDKNNKMKKVKLKCKYNHSNDIIILSFNFIENQLEYYINNKNNMATKISLSHKKSIIPAFSSLLPSSTIEIVKWELH